MLTQAPKGTQDMLPQRRAPLAGNRGGHALCVRAGRLPRDPHADVRAHRAVPARRRATRTDVVQKEMYTFNDKGGRSITLTPGGHGSASCARAASSTHLYAESAAAARLYYVTCPCFRYEKPQAGRLRQFHQNGVEVFGAKDASRRTRRSSLSALDILRALRHRAALTRAHQLHRLSPVPRGLSGSAEGVPRPASLTPCARPVNERFERNPLRILDCKEDAAQTHRRAGDAGLPVRGLPRPLRRAARAIWTRMGVAYERRSPHRARAGLLHQDRV